MGNYSFFVLTLLCSFNLLFITCVVSTDPSIFYYFLDHGTDCVGNGTEDKMSIQIFYDIRNVYRSEGWVETHSFTSKRYYRFTLCGSLANTTCEGDWCFEEVNKTANGTYICAEGLSNWEESKNTTIGYYAMFNSNDTTTAVDPIGLHVQIADTYQKNKDCPNHISELNYNLFCDSSTNKTSFVSLYENYTRCVWNISIRTPYACLTWETIVPNPSNNGSTSSIAQLSGGSIFVIIVVVLVLMYLILGCAYNSFYHGRVGCDAIPNKQFWTNIARYTKAGCETTKDCLCCSQGNLEYQNL